MDFIQQKGPQDRICTANSGCSAAWLARFVRDEEAGGSNPPTPTINHSPKPLTTL